ncbi:uncharacterized protein LOC108834691 [Raphanus sativus]|uniref:Uncharacterized protein LOC108834691 n=1 Tax=Raphanus sativus TaxID=3726 RepID=A0A6J0LUR2_RAPSA|nr:uncharacterized protein LOC108834691 [Raphanus sativus]
MTEFRPISLCNVSYKIISKLLSKRLKRVLPDLISETQSAFVSRRLITDNILLAQENFHALRTNTCARENFMAIKTDMSKAYDRVEWSFIRSLLLRLGFAEKLVDLLMFCITSVSYQVIINGEPRGKITPTRGLRQGDPLSPFLFIMCTEALISLLKGAEEEKRILGLRVARASPRVSHLLFADDSLFFCKAEVSQCKEILGILDTYGKASGQQLNAAKSSIIFGNKIDHSVKQNLKGVMGITTEGGMGKYLGLPEQMCGSKMKVFSYVQDRLNGCVNSWSARLLSKGGKEVQIKSVAQAVPTYSMSCYLLPQGIIDKLESAVSNFWWSSSQNNRGLHWIAWDKICVPHDQGGLGFLDLHAFNIALLAKQLWRLIQFPNSLLARVLRGRYYNRSSPLEDRKVYSPSYGWRSIMAAKPLLKAGLRKTIGAGLNTFVWTEPWIPDIDARPPRPSGRVTYRHPKLLVHSFIRRDTRDWDTNLLLEHFHPEDIPLILKLRPSNTWSMDGYAWNYTKSGTYTVKSGYNRLQEIKACDAEAQTLQPSITGLQSHVWKINAPGKMKHFMWQALTGCIATTERLAYRHLGTDRSCPRCGDPEETINHLLFECPPAIQVWALSDYPSLPGYFPSTSVYQNMNFLFWKKKNVAYMEPLIETFPWILWYIWKARNDKVFNGKEVSPVDTLRLASIEAECWRAANLPQEGEEEEAQSAHLLSSHIHVDLQRPTCQVDASWIDNGTVSGLGWFYKDHMGVERFGLQGCRKSLSSLHAEMEGLIWAMSCLREFSCDVIHMETDCSDLVDMIANPTDWPAFNSELVSFRLIRARFSDFSISHIPRSRNTRADSLAKEARCSGVLFTHIDQTQPDRAFLRNHSRPTTT